jgi:hypothetical protein
LLAYLDISLMLLISNEFLNVAFRIVSLKSLSAKDQDLVYTFLGTRCIYSIIAFDSLGKCLGQ